MKHMCFFKSKQFSYLVVYSAFDAHIWTRDLFQKFDLGSETNDVYVIISLVVLKCHMFHDHGSITVHVGSYHFGNSIFLSFTFLVQSSRWSHLNRDSISECRYPNEKREKTTYNEMCRILTSFWLFMIIRSPMVSCFAWTAFRWTTSQFIMLVVSPECSCQCICSMTCFRYESPPHKPWLMVYRGPQVLCAGDNFIHTNDCTQRCGVFHVLIISQDTTSRLRWTYDHLAAIVKADIVVLRNWFVENVLRRVILCTPGTSSDTRMVVHIYADRATVCFFLAIQSVGWAEHMTILQYVSMQIT